MLATVAQTEPRIHASPDVRACRMPNRVARSALSTMARIEIPVRVRNSSQRSSRANPSATRIVMIRCQVSRTPNALMPPCATRLGMACGELGFHSTFAKPRRARDRPRVAVSFTIRDP